MERVWGNSQWVCSLATLRERGGDLPRAQLHTSIPPTLPSQASLPRDGFGKSQKDFPPPLPSAVLSSLA